ncbi:MAG: sigma-70 family RNA polymerase sigma factor [Candidatus Margulisiibacteriota bacterium]|nr:sigma-70 family RNA polymerase sigma factor [Candidatus Margulisiibacteriota bacterium]
MPGKQDIEDQIVRVMRNKFLEKTDEVLEKYNSQISSTVSWYVRSLPRHIAKSEADDLASEARIAFVEAIKNWDPRRGELWSYVNFRLKGAMQDYLRKKKMDTVSGMHEWINSAAHVYLAFNREAVVHNTVDEIMHVDTALEKLDEKERYVVENYYKQDKTFKEIGKEIGLSESQVSRISKEATLKLKKAMVPEDQGEMRE